MRRSDRIFRAVVSVVIGTAIVVMMAALLMALTQPHVDEGDVVALIDVPAYSTTVMTPIKTGKYTTVVIPITTQHPEQYEVKVFGCAKDKCFADTWHVSEKVYAMLHVGEHVTKQELGIA